MGQGSGICSQMWIDLFFPSPHFLIRPSHFLLLLPMKCKKFLSDFFFPQKSQLKSSPDHPIPKHISLFRMGIIYSKTTGLPSTDTSGFLPSWTTAAIVSGVATPAQHSVYFYQIFAESPSESVPWLSFCLSGMGKQRNGVFEGGWWLTGRDLCTLPIVGRGVPSQCEEECEPLKNGPLANVNSYHSAYLALVVPGMALLYHLSHLAQQPCDKGWVGGLL